GSIPQHNAGKGARGGRAVDRPRETLLDEVGKVATVVDVRMAEQDSIDILGSEGKLAVAADALGAMALKKAAVQKDGTATRVHAVHRTRYCPSSPPKGDCRFRCRSRFLCHEPIVGISAVTYVEGVIAQRSGAQGITHTSLTGLDQPGPMLFKAVAA